MVWTYTLAIILLSCVVILPAHGGDYAQSAHGAAGAGVLRSSMPTAYVQGNCAHCHAQHASVAGSEESPSGFALFSSNFSEKPGAPYEAVDNVCFQCHTALLSPAEWGLCYLIMTMLKPLAAMTKAQMKEFLNSFNHSSGTGKFLP